MEFRADRLATVYFFHPLRRLLGRGSAGIPILMYHSISNDVEVGTKAYFRICTAPRVFREHLKLLSSSGYKTIGLGEAVCKLDEGKGSTEKLVVLTFDDGYEDFYTEAFPILSEFGYSATVFLPTAYIGEIARSFNGRSCLTWRQVRELKAAGIEFGSHTVTHPQLRALSANDVQRELRSSKEQIEDRLGNESASFSYPYAFPEPDWPFRQNLRHTLVQAGYKNGVSTIIGTADASSDRLFLERLPVSSGDDDIFFKAKLQGGYDWLHTVQVASKLSAAVSAGSYPDPISARGFPVDANHRQH